MLDMRERYNISPAVLIPNNDDNGGELADKCRENNIQFFIAKFGWWVGGQPRKSFTRTIKQAVKYYPRKIRNYFRLSRLMQRLTASKFDLIHTNSSVIEYGDIIAQKLKLPHLWHLREYGIDDYGLHYIKPYSYVRETYSRANAIIAISKSLYDSYVNERKLCSPDNTRIIYNGIRVPDSYEKKYLYDDRVNFCIVGGIGKGKNQIMAINACIKLKSLTDKFMLNIIGSCNEQYLNELQEIIRTNDLDNYVKFWGRQDYENVNQILRNMDVGLMPSRREAFGRVTVEYMLNYMPVIGVNTGATPEIIDNESGFICELDDSGKLADLMQKFITNPELLAKMCSKACERSIKNFSLEHNTDEIYKLYQEILTRK